MKISMWSSYLMEFSPEDMVKIFAQHAWKYIELSDEHGWALLEKGNPIKVGRQFRKYATEQGVSFPQGHLYLAADIAHPDKAERNKVLDDLKRWCDLFIALDIKFGVLHPGGHNWSDDVDRQKIVDIQQESLKQLLAYLAGSATIICLENVLKCGATIDELLMIMAPFKRDNLGICLDTGHLNITARDFTNFICKAGNDLKELHIADNLGVNDDHMLPYGKGTVPWGSVLSALKEIGYDKVFNFEVPGETACPEQVKLAKLDYAKNLAELMIKMAT